MLGILEFFIKLPTPFRKEENMKRYCLRSCLLIAVTLCSVSTLLSAPGDLDISFGQGGRIVTDIEGDYQISKVMIQNDGKILTIGTSNYRMVLSRLNSNGTSDESFGSRGRIIYTPPSSIGYGISLALQPDGKIIALAVFYYPDLAITVIRYNSNGTLDASFGQSGVIVTRAKGFTTTSGNAVVVTQSGRILVAGLVATNSIQHSCLIRYLANGELDPGFGTNGIAISDADDSLIKSIALEPEGKIIAAGRQGAFAVSRYNPNGILDTTFNGGTTVLSDIFGEAMSTALQSDGKVLAGGYVWNPVLDEHYFCLARFNTDGSADRSFGSNGRIVTEFTAFNFISDLFVQANGRIVVGGGSPFKLLRFTVDGKPDHRFGVAGRVVDFTGGYSAMFGLALQPDGKIVAVGLHQDYDQFIYRGVIARYQGLHGSQRRVFL